MSNKKFTITQPTEIIFGNGKVTELPEIIQKSDNHTPLLVIDPGLVKAGVGQKITQPLYEAGIKYTVYDEIDPEPGLKLADKGCEIALQQKCDCVIGVGGGSAMDVAKAISVLVTNGGKAVDYLGIGKVNKAGLTKIMIPTSAGTGAEVTFTAVFINEETGSKGGMNDNNLYPDIALLDPELSLSLPPHVTAATGIDALTHALEGFTSVQANPVSEIYSQKAIKLISENLPTAYADGRNIEARANMLLASLLAGKALATAGVGLVHAMAYPLGGMFGVPHGLANAVLLPFVTEYNLIGNLEKHAILAELLGEDVSNLSTREAAEVTVEILHNLNADLQIPASLRELNIDENRIEEMAEIALTVKVPIDNNPRVPSKDDIIKIYEQAMM